MKKIQYIAFAAAVVLTSCNKEQGFEPSDRVAAEFTEATITRATATAWEAGDAIGVYMVANDGALTDAAAIDGAANISHTISDPLTGTFAATPTEQIYFPVDGSAVDFHAYYPHQAGMTDGVYKVDVSDQSDHPAIDLLTAKVANKTKTSPSVAFQFAHRLSKLSITIAAGDGLKAADLTGVTVKITGLPATANYNIGTGVFTPATTTTDIAAQMTGANGLTAEAILIPQTITANSVQVVFTLTNDMEFGWNLAALALEGGSNHTYAIKLNRTGVTVTSSNIDDWNPIPGVPGTAEEIAKSYSVGDYYPDAVHPIGVVFYLDNPDATGKGEHGKVVNLKESLSTLAWGPYATTTAASDMDNGLFNMRTVKGLSSDFSDYPAFAYVDGLNHNPTGTSYADGSTGVWYLPAKNELKQLYAAMSGLRWIASGTAGEGEIADWGGGEMPGNATYSAVREAFNDKFTADGVGGKEIGSVYWSSTEDGSNGAWYVYFGSGNAGDGYKSNLNYVRSCLAF